MPAPDTGSAVTRLTGSSGNALIDAMLATEEGLRSTVEQRDEVIGTATYKWGGPLGTGTVLTFSFITPSSIFASSSPPHADGIVGMYHRHFNKCHAMLVRNGAR